jgi:hypothetical protein
MNHLRDEQLAGWLAGEADRETRSHLESCPQCRAEAVELREGISRYSIAMRRQAGGAQRTHLSGNFAPRKALALHRLRWAGAGVLALLLAAQTAWLMKPQDVRPHHEPPNARQTGSAAVSSQPAAASSASQLSDDELLEAVNNDLSREVPLALAPVGAITTARNRIAAEASVTTTGSDPRKR